MSTELETIRGIARQSLMPDFFAVMVEEEGLWNSLRQLLSGIQGAARGSALDKIITIAGEAKSAGDFMEKIKAVNLWLPFKELVTHLQVK
jgi:hypothetical protein